MRIVLSKKLKDSFKAKQEIIAFLRMCYELPSRVESLKINFSLHDKLIFRYYVLRKHKKIFILFYLSQQYTIN